MPFRGPPRPLKRVALNRSLWRSFPAEIPRVGGLAVLAPFRTLPLRRFRSRRWSPSKLVHPHGCPYPGHFTPDDVYDYCALRQREYRASGENIGKAFGTICNYLMMVDRLESIPWGSEKMKNLKGYLRCYSNRQDFTREPCIKLMAHKAKTWPAFMTTSGFERSGGIITIVCNCSTEDGNEFCLLCNDKWKAIAQTMPLPRGTLQRILNKI